MIKEENEVQYVATDGCYIFNCPHCELPVQVEQRETNCKIFRHGQLTETYILKFNDRTVQGQFRTKHFVPIITGYSVATKVVIAPGFPKEGQEATIIRVIPGQQINPHSPQAHCERLVNQGLVYGCGKPFQLVPGKRLLADGSRIMESVKKCGYI